MRGESWLAEYLHEMTAARGLGVPIPAQGCVPVIGRGAHPSRVRVPEVEPAVIAAAGAPTDGSRIAVVACRRDPQAAKPGIKGRVAPGDLSCRAHAASSHRSSVLSTRVAFVTSRLEISAYREWSIQIAEGGAIPVSRRTVASVDLRRARSRIGSQLGGGGTPQSGCHDGSAFQNMILSK